MRQTTIIVIITTASTAALAAPTTGPSGTVRLEGCTASGIAGRNTVSIY